MAARTKADAVVLLDASAVLAMLFAEPGAGQVEARIGDADISAVNAAEVIGKLVDKGVSPGLAAEMFDALLLPVTDFPADAGREAGKLRAATAEFGLSLGDRACLAEALVSGKPVLTADRAWARLDLGVEIEVIR